MALTPPSIPDHELLKKIGGGSYGEVWLARNVLGQHRAVKVVYRASFEQDKPYEREFAGIQKFEPISRAHEGHVDILHVGRNNDAGYFYYVMELADAAEVPGAKCQLSGEGAGPIAPLTPDTGTPDTYTPRTLKNEIKRRGPLPVDECVSIGLALARALAHLHTHGLVHRDIKPSNIIFVDGAPKLADIGLVTGIDATRSFVGTDGYIPPEGPGTPQADLYSLGKVLYEMSTGKDRQDFPELPTEWRTSAERERLLEFNEVILKACDSDLRQRYPSAQEIEADLALLQTGRSVRRLHIMERRLAMATKVGMALGTIALIAVGAYFGALRQARRAQRAEQETARQLYVADLALAQHSWEKGDVGRALEILETHRPRPTDKEDLRGFEWFYIWRLCQKDALQTFHADPTGVSSLALSTDGKTLAAAGSNGTLMVWDVASRHALATIPGHSTATVAGQANDVTFSPDNKTLVYASDDGSIKVWDTIARREVASLTVPGVTPRSLVLSPDGTMLAFGALSTNTVTLLDMRTGQVLATLKAKEGDLVLSVAFSPNGKFLAAGCRDSTIVVWDVESRQQTATLTGLMGFVWCLAFSPDGKTLASAGIGADLALWDLARTNIAATLSGHQDDVIAVAFSPDGRFIATGSDDHTVRLWDATSHKTLATLRGHRRGLTLVSFARDGEMVASAGNDGTVKLWQTRPDSERDVLKGHADWARSAVFSPDGKTLFSGSRDKTIKLWDVASGREVSSFPGHKRPVFRLALSPDGETLASVSGLTTETSGLGEIKLWDVARRTELVTLTNQNCPISSVAFSPDGGLLSTGDGNGTICLWNVHRRQQCAMLPAHNGRVNGLAFSSDGRILTSASSDGLVKLWDVANHREQFSFQSYSAGLWEGAWSVAFSPDGRLLAAGNTDGTVNLLEVRSRRLVANLKGPAGFVYSLAFTPDGKTLATSGRDGTLTLWHMPSLRAVAAFKQHQSFIESVAFSPDGTILASASSDKTVRLWRAATRAEADSIRPQREAAR